MKTSTKKILFVLGLIFAVTVFYALYNLTRFAPSSDKYSVAVETGDRPIDKEIKIIIHTGGGTLNLREERSRESKILATIKDKAKLTAKTELEGWYKVEYEGKEGWILKEFTLLDTGTAEETKRATEKLATFDGTGYSFKYPLEWDAKTFETDEGDAVIGLSNETLPETYKAGRIPIELTIYSDKPLGDFRTDKDTKKGTITVAGTTGAKYSYVSTETSVLVTVAEFEKNGETYSFLENGGFWQDLEKILKTVEFE